MYEEFGKDVQFFVVYIREAHPIDGRSPGRNHTVEDPISTEERKDVASNFIGELKLNLPVLLDQIDDRVNKAYSAAPDRLYLIGKDGKLAYIGGRGPQGFKPNELKQAMIEELEKGASQ